MNKNLPQAADVARAAMATPSNDLAKTVVQALDDVGLLVDPERQAGTVLHRTADGGWERAPQGQPEYPADAEQPERPELPKRHAQETDLEEQARAWDEACERARRAADTIRLHVGPHPAFQGVQVDGDRLLVSLHIVDQRQWGEWRTYFGISHDKERPLPYVVGGDGHRDGVRVSVVAYDLPEARAHALRIAKAPYELEGLVYDLALPQQDVNGGTWFFEGARAEDGMPLLSQDGRPEQARLSDLTRQAGGLTPVTDNASQLVTPVMTTVTGGEQA